jgi:antitoxin HicB
MFYPVTLTKDDNGSSLVRFPDVPEAVTFGDTKAEALERAIDALLTAFDAYIKNRRDIPMPTTSKRGGLGVEVPALDASKIALYQTMRTENVSKSELGRRLNWHLPQVDRVLQVRHGSQLDQIAAAFGAMGKRIRIEISDLDAPVPGAIITKAKAVARHKTRVRFAAKKR